MPALRDRAFALVIERRSRAVLFATNAAAERAGLSPGMPLADARAILPGVTIEPARMNADAMMLEKIRAWCGRYSPWTATGDASDEKGQEEDEPQQALEGPGGGGLWLDATGCAHLFGGEEAMLADLIGRVNRLGFAARAAMAETKGAAWALARYGGTDETGWTVAPPGTVHAALSPLPTAALRLSPATVAQLHAVGLRAIGDLLPLPRASLATRYGAALIERLDAALGNIFEPVSPTAPEQPLFVRLSFAEPIGNPDDIAAALDRLLTLLCRKMAERAVGTRGLIFTLYRTDGTTEHRTAGTARPVRDPAALARLFADRLDDIDPGFGIEDATLFAHRTDTLGAAQTGLAGPDAARDFDALIDRLVNRFGAENVLRPRLTESHLPERAGTFAPVTAKPDNADAPDPAAPRPVRLLRPPEEIETIAAISGLAIAPPAMFRWRRVLHRVVFSEGPERIAPEWWRQKNAGTRDYFQIEDSAGQRFWLFRETTDQPTAPCWYVHGLFA